MELRLVVDRLRIEEVVLRLHGIWDIRRRGLKRGRASGKLHALENLSCHRGILDGRDEAQPGPAARAA